ncbi:MAG: hypothetical protein M3R09_11205 [Actinomycetota bacterium]|nr:hypothetical protein [Actinomycetota bacterium]
MSTGERTTAETLLAAAALLLERAGQATHGPWEADQFTDSGRIPVGSGPWDVVAPVGDEDLEDIAVCGDENGRAEANARWIATVHPGIAGPLARLLEIEAANARGAFEDYENYYHATIAVARLILGEVAAS